MINCGSLRSGIAIAAAAAVLISGCGDTPEGQLTSAKNYLAKNDAQAAVIQLRNALQSDPDLAEARFLLGKTLLENGDVAGAEKELRKALELQYSAEHAAPPLARALTLLGQHEEVIRELAKIQIEAPDARAELLTAVGNAYLSLKNPSAAQRVFALAVAAQPKYVPAYLGQARLSAIAGNLDEAAATVDKALAISPANADAWQLKGDILLDQKQVEPALAAYRKAVDSNGDFLQGHVAIVTLLLNEERLNDAAKQLAAMTQIAPRHPKTLYLQALLAYGRKDFTGARQATQQQLRLVPTDPRGLALAGAIDLELKSYAQAEAHLLKALEQAPGLRVARRTLISAYLRNGQVSKALTVLKPVLKEIDGDPDMMALAGEAFMTSGDTIRAADYFAKASALDPADGRKRTAVALTRVDSGEADRGLRELEQLAASDSDSRADLALIATHMNRRQYDKALAAIAALEKKRPADPLPHNLRGTALLAKRDSGGARRSFERALQLDPTYFIAAHYLAGMDIAEKKPETARVRYEGVLAKDPNNSGALLALASLQAATAQPSSTPAARSGAASEPQDVVALISKAIAADPAAPSPRLALIRHYIGTKEFSKAAAAAQAAMTAIPDRPEILDAAGSAYLAAGDAFQAISVYRKLASLQRTSPQPYLRLAEAQWAAKNTDDAIESLHKALAIKPDMLQAQRSLIALHLSAGRIKNALALARDIQKQRPTEPFGYMYEGEVHALQKNWSQAAATYRAGLTQVSGSPDLAVRLHAVLAASAGAEGDQFAASWLEDRPTDAVFRLYLAQALGARKDYAGAAQHYRKVLETAPNNPAVLNNLAWAAAQIKDAKAIEYAEKANALAPNQPAFMDTLGALLLDKGDTARALGLLQKASAMEPQSAAIRLNLAKALLKAGQKEAARKELDELIKLGDQFSGHNEAAQLRRAL